MTQIKQQQSQSPVRKKKSNFLKMIQQKQQQLIQAVLKHHSPAVIQSIQRYTQQKSILQQYLELSFDARTKKIHKNIVAELSSLPCFKIPDSSPYLNKELLTMMRRDLETVVSVCAMFVHGKSYGKGQIVEIAGKQRDRIRVLLRGDAQTYEPINHRSYRYVVEKIEQGKIQVSWIDKVLKGGYHFDIQGDIMLDAQLKEQQDIQSELFQEAQDKQTPLPLELCRKILTHSNISSSLSPQKQTLHLKKEGQLVCSQLHPFFISQPSHYHTTVICLSQCYFMELEYDIYKQLIFMLDSDEERKYVQALLRRFNMMEYFDAKMYVRIEWMIDKAKQQRKNQPKTKDNPQLAGEYQHLTQFKDEKTFEIHLTPLNHKYEAQDQSLQTQFYELKYTGDIYLIASGVVTIYISKIQQKRYLPLQHSTPQLHQIPTPLLSLFSPDIFGWESIGKNPMYKLRYMVRRDSKLLLLDQSIYVKQWEDVQGLREAWEHMKNERDEVLAHVIREKEELMESQMLQKVKNMHLKQGNSKQINKSHIQLSKNATQNTSKIHRTTTIQNAIQNTLKNLKNASKLQQSSSMSLPKLVRQVQYFGNKNFQQIQASLIHKLSIQNQQSPTAQSFQTLIPSGSYLSSRLSFSPFLSHNLPSNTNIVGQFIEIRDRNGKLLRKRSIGGEETAELTILKKIGIVSPQDRYKHNLEVVKGRKNIKLEEMGMEGRQLRRLRDMAKSLPKLEKLYAKKEDMLYKNQHRRKLSNK